MKRDYLKYFYPQAFMGLSGLLLTGVYYLNQCLPVALSTFGVAAGTISLVTTKAWKLPPFKWLFWVDNLSGTYEGYIKWQYREKNGEVKKGRFKHVKVIVQNGYKITVNSYTFKEDGSPSSPSVNKGMYVDKTKDDKCFTMVYSYFNDGSTEQGFCGHYGTDVLKFIKNGEQMKISGKYYTNRYPYQTRGEYAELKRVSNNTNHKF